jgi:hypothetical protein
MIGLTSDIARKPHSGRRLLVVAVEDCDGFWCIGWMARQSSALERSLGVDNVVIVEEIDIDDVCGRSLASFWHRGLGDGEWLLDGSHSACARGVNKGTLCGLG